MSYITDNIKSHFQTHIEIIRDFKNGSLPLDETRQILADLSPELSLVISPKLVQEWADENITKPKRKYTSHNWEAKQDKIHNYLIRLEGNVKATAEHICPNRKHAGQSLNTWLKRRGGKEKFIVDHERVIKERKAVKPVNPTPTYNDTYIKMLEAVKN